MDVPGILGHALLSRLRDVVAGAIETSEHTPVVVCLAASTAPADPLPRLRFFALTLDEAGQALESSLEKAQWQLTPILLFRDRRVLKSALAE